MTDHVAVFVDGDNVSARDAGRIIRLARSMGTVVLARSYGGANALENWKNAASFQFTYSGCGKNATDVLIAVEATDYVNSYPVKTALLCSSDADFTHIARYIRSRGTHVVGVGAENTKMELRHACSEFHVLSRDVAEPSKPTHLSDMDREIFEVFCNNGFERCGMRVADLNPVMRKEYGTKISMTPDRNWRTYFTKRPEIYDLDPRGKDARVRFKPCLFD